MLKPNFEKADGLGMSTPKWFWVYIKNRACLKILSMLVPNFEKADGLGIGHQKQPKTKLRKWDEKLNSYTNFYFYWSFITADHSWEYVDYLKSEYFWI